MSATEITEVEVYRAVERGYQRMFDEIAGLTEALYDRELYEIALAVLKKKDIEQRFEGWFWGG